VFEGIDSRFLGPGCGNGNFLVAMLERKIIAINEAEHGGTDRVIARDRLQRQVRGNSLLQVKPTRGPANTKAACRNPQVLLNQLENN